MRRAILSVFCLAVAVASGQWLETTIYLPDSFGGMTGPQCFTYNSRNNTGSSRFCVGDLGGFGCS